MLFVVTIDTFAMLDLRVGSIRSASEIEGARKPLYKLEIDFGGDYGVKIIVAGIKDSYAKEDLVDKKVVCIVNLDHKAIAGVESEGMLLAAGESGGISLLVPDRDMPLGSKIH